MIAVLFAVSYQSVHIFSHENHSLSNVSDSTDHHVFKTYDTSYSASDDCPICDFKFVAFLAPEVVHFDFIPSFYEIPYLLYSNEAIHAFEKSVCFLRGPPSLV